MAYKILSSVMNGWLKIVTEKIIGEYQCGFHPNRSIVEQLFVIRQVKEMSYNYNMDLNMLFVDFKHAFDSVHRKGLYTA
jgi:hypothetical protein